MIYLSRLILNPRSRQVRSEMANPYEMHRTVMKAFAGRFTGDTTSPTEGRVLFRLEIHPRTHIPTLLVQSPIEPDWSFLLAAEKNYLLDEAELPLEVENPGVKAIDLRLRTGQILSFRLRANPTVKKSREEKKQGRREGLLREEDQMAWLQRKVSAAGGKLVAGRAAQETLLHGKRMHPGQSQNLSFLSVQFDGTLQVDDPERLIQAVQSGIGSGKGMGFGLLSLAPAAR